MKKPVIYDQDLHRPLAGGETLDPSAIPISSEEGNIATVGEDGLYVPSPNVGAILANLKDCEGNDHVPDNKIPTCDQMDEAIAEALANAIDQLPGGMGETWESILALRTAGVTYTNTTGKPIFISVGFKITGTGYGTLRVDGVLVGEVNNTSDYGITAPISAIVPHGSTYVADKHLGASLSRWAELS